MNTNNNNNNNNAPDPYYILRGHKSNVNSVLFDVVNPNLLYSGSGDGELKLWNIEEKKCITTITAHTDGSAGGILSLQLMNNLAVNNEITTNNSIVSQGRDGTIKIWNNETMANTFKLETNSMSLGKCSVYSNYLAIGSTDESPSQVEIWDTSSKSIINKLKPNNKQLFDKLGLPMFLKLFYQSDQLRLCSAFENGELLIWDTRNTSIPLIVSKLHNEPILSFALSNDTTRGISGSGDSNLIEFNLNYPSHCFDITKTHKLNNPGISDIKIRPSDEKIYATSGWDKRIRIYNFKKQTPLAILKYHTESVYSIDFNSNNILASGSKDTRIALWDIYNSNSNSNNSNSKNK